jgi:flagellar M-ring protein FliF
MDVFNKLLAQLSDLFKTMSPGARLTAGLLLVAVVVSIGYLFNAQSGGGDAYLLNGQSFTADEMSAMEGAFGKAGLSDYTVDGSRIRISKSRQAVFLGALADEGAMPARFGDHLTKAVNDIGPFSSRQHSEEMIKIAKQKELAAVIRSMQGVENATVMFDMHKKPGIKAETAVTASVSVKPRGTQPMDAGKVPMIRSLVAGAIAGLSPEQVSVIDLNGRSYSGAAGTGGSSMGAAFDDPYIQRVNEYQSRFENNIAARLSHIPGVLVTANVELDRTMRTIKKQHEVDPKSAFPLVKRETESTLTSESGGGPKGPPGLGAQQQGANTGASLGGAGGGTSKTEDTKTESESTITGSHGTTESELAGMTPKSVAVSVGVPTTYFEKVWLQRNPAPAGQEQKKPDATALQTIADEELKNIRTAVAALIPDPITTTGTPIDKMSLIDVAAYSPVTSTESIGPSFFDRALDWLAQSWSTVAMIGLGLVSLLMLKSFVKSIPAPGQAPSVLQNRIAGEDSDSDEDGAAAAGDPAKPKTRTLQRRLGTGANLREELIDMVKEDPDAAANVLRNWIGNVT